jgi:hypothetical protein
MNFYVFAITSSRYRRQVKYFFIKKCWKSLKQLSHIYRNTVDPLNGNAPVCGVEVD